MFLYVPSGASDPSRAAFCSSLLCLALRSQALIAFGTAVDDGAYDRAVDILESAAKQVRTFECFFVCVCCYESASGCENIECA